MRKFTIFILLLSVFLGGQAHAASFEWREAGSLPTPIGFSKSIGVAAPLAGVLDGYLIVGGGTNFPNKPVAERGQKEWYSDLFLFGVDDKGNLKLEEHSALPYKTSGGVSISRPEGIYYFGGENAEGDSDVVLMISWKEKGKSLTVKQVGKLPFTWASGSGAYHDGIVYLLPGRVDKKASNEFYSYEISSGEVKKLASLPGEQRSQSVSAVIKNAEGDFCFYTFGGLSPLTQTDGYSYKIKSGEWKAAAGAELNGKPFALGGGAAVALSDTEILALGGVNKEIFDDATKKMGELKDEALEKYRVDYFNWEPAKYLFSDEIMVYDSVKNMWRSDGKLTFPGGAGPIGLVKDGNVVWFISGERKPGVRTEKVQRGIIK